MRKYSFGRSITKTVATKARNVHAVVVFWQSTKTARAAANAATLSMDKIPF